MLTDALAASAAELVRSGLVTAPRLTFYRVPPEMVRGGYPISKATPNGMPLRALMVHPEVWPAFKVVAPRIVITDLTRTAESSLNRMAEKPGLVQAPGYSDHGVGGAFDLDIAASLKHGGFANRTALDCMLAMNGWPMFWWLNGGDAPKPNKPGAEVYHHSYYDGAPLPEGSGRSTAAMAERRMLRWYPWLDVSTWTDKARTAQYCLARLGHYHGALDGSFGPLSRTALAMFQRALKVATWGRKKGLTHFEAGRIDKVTARVLAFCAAERVIEKAPGRED